MIAQAFRGWTAVDPATGKEVAAYELMTDSEVGVIIAQARAAQESWRWKNIEFRARRLVQLGRVLRDRVDEWAELMALEMGKPVRQGRDEVEKCARLADYYAENGATFLAPEMVETEAARSYVMFRPLGLVLGIMPWNFPFWQVVRFAAPALLAGNGGLLKHAPNVPGCAAALEELFLEAGFPQNLFRSLRVDTDQVGEVIDHPAVSAVTLTGSARAGRAVAARAGAALKKTLLELGGSDPYLILDDADVEAAAELGATSRLINSGQSCIAAKRFLVTESLREAFETLLTKRFSSAVVGDPRAENTEVGPLARHDLRDALHEQVSQSLEAGARCLVGGQPLEGPGAFYAPTVLTDVRPGMPAFDEELFGPVAAVVPVADEGEAIEFANRSTFGLGAAVFTADSERGERIAAELLEAGACFVNDFVRSDPRLPFGGVKQSGYGRELGSFGIREFVNVKTVVVS
ncbi:MAG: NAD-dependent succinate-semialdehyde dehydrogenase [Gemmatimonadota bacterium]